MARRRLAVVILAPNEATAGRVDALRQALGVREPFHVPPHCTVIPPTNVRVGDMPALFEVMRSATSECRSFRLEIGPVATFAPVTPTVHLGVGGSGLDELRRLRAALRRGPLDRPEAWPTYEPHVTLRESSDPEAIESALGLLSGVRDSWAVGSVHLLEHRPCDRSRPDLGSRWEPIREEPLGGPAVVGRGGMAIALRVVAMVEEQVADLCGIEPVGPLAGPDSPRPLSVVAESADDPGSMLGAAVGRCPVGSTVAELDAVVVESSRHGEGIGRHLVAAWLSAAADRGAVTTIARSERAPRADEGSGADYLISLGFVPAGRGGLVRYVR